ncbi:unnamed protein product [Linum tenue]|uniref:Uncharacterized protein n=2 Tax=Linum tenue TaxID=586396 RepID=A0AAV0JJC2_9ROSI|nr:unnamed protein product [Linum tenue]
MQQPATPNAVRPKEGSNGGGKPAAPRKKPPTPQELISHYETQGMSSHEASMKVIEDLQNVLFRVVSANSSKAKKDKAAVDASRKIDVVNSRVAVVDMKLDSKPGYLGAFGVGIASGVALRGVEKVLPNVLEGIGQIWSAVGSVTKPPTSSSSS